MHRGESPNGILGAKPSKIPFHGPLRMDQRSERPDLFQGKYHFFYQFNPYSGFWSQMHWGHAVSDDLMHWEQLPVALAPSESYDDHPQGGCFSGSAIEKDGKLYLIYTGTANNGNGFEQTQNVAVSEDGIHFKKYEGNPVIEPPSGIPHDFFRDPKVWEHDGTYYLVCGAQRDGKAQALLYHSPDLLHWDFFNVLFESRGEWGYMWECPDFFPLGDQWVFLCSPWAPAKGPRSISWVISIIGREASPIPSRERLTGDSISTPPDVPGPSEPPHHGRMGQ